MTEKDIRKMFEEMGKDPESFIEEWKVIKKFKKELKKEYYEIHEVCPKCYSTCDNYDDTYVNFLIHFHNIKTFKDQNKITCYVCGWKGITHDLIKKPKEIHIDEWDAGKPMKLSEVALLISELQKKYGNDALLFFDAGYNTAQAMIITTKDI